MAAAARMASATSLPATKRALVRWPKLELSAMARRERLSERAMNAALSTGHRIAGNVIVAGSDCQGRSLRGHSLGELRHDSIFYHKLRRAVVRTLFSSARIP